MCFRLIEAKKAQHPVSRLCEVLGVSRAGYYAWTRRPVSERERRDRELSTLIERILNHIDHKTTDMGEGLWHEPVAHYTSQARFEAEITKVLRRTPTPSVATGAASVPA